MAESRSSVPTPATRQRGQRDRVIGDRGETQRRSGARGVRVLHGVHSLSECHVDADTGSAASRRIAARYAMFSGVLISLSRPS